MTTHSQEPGSGQPLRVVIAGAGKMARHHAAAVRASVVPARVVGVADPSAEARAAMLEVVPEAREFGSLHEALADLAADVVHVCTPPATHEDLALTAIEAGCHVYVEKPFAADEAEARRILEAAGGRGVKVCPGHQLLFERPAREAWDLLPTLGELQHVESYFAFRPVRGRGGQAPVREEDQLLDILPHPTYVLIEAFEAAGVADPTEVVSLEMGRGTMHAVLRRGPLTGSLIVTLTGRPVDSYLRLVGTNGSVHADFVRGIVLRQIGPGSSGIDKLLAPYRTARQLSLGTTGAMIRRFLGRKRSYPGLREIFEAFYAHISRDAPPPVSTDSLLQTVRVQAEVAAMLNAEDETTPATDDDVVFVTGGTGFLGRAVVEELRRQGRAVRVLARRLPASWNRVAGVDYVTGDLAEGFDPAWLKGVSSVVHCAAATSGGWEEHQAASIDATRHLVDAMATSPCKRLVHVSSIAVVEDPDEIDESSPYLDDPRGSGPYAWGKLESERLARSKAGEAGLDVTVVRPGAIVDYDDFDPPGRLGKRAGNIFVAVGGRGEKMGVVSLSFCANAIVHLAADSTTPDVVNLLDPKLPTRRELVEQLRQRNPDLFVVWIPRWTVRPLGFATTLLQKVLRPGQVPIEIAAVFGNRQYDNGLVADMAQRLSEMQVRSVATAESN
jgi:predicted dehydrogenase/nucleoside-diphosphate-sugar epimerase